MHLGMWRRAIFGNMRSKFLFISIGSNTTLTELFKGLTFILTQGKNTSKDDDTQIESETENDDDDEISSGLHSQPAPEFNRKELTRQLTLHGGVVLEDFPGIKESIPEFDQTNTNLEIELGKESYKDSMSKIKSAVGSLN